MLREELIDVFKETVEVVNNGFYVNNKGEKVEIITKSPTESIFYDSDITGEIDFKSFSMKFKYSLSVKIK